MSGAGWYLKAGGVHVVPWITPCRWPLAGVQLALGLCTWKAIYETLEISCSNSVKPVWLSFHLQAGINCCPSVERREEMFRSLPWLFLLASTPLFSHYLWKLNLDSQGKALSWSPAAGTAVGSATAHSHSWWVPKVPGGGAPRDGRRWRGMGCRARVMWETPMFTEQSDVVQKACLC